MTNKQRQKLHKEQTDILRERSPKEWRALVDQVPKDIRAYVARLIWWDWFSHRSTTERWSELDDFLNIPYAQLMWERENPDKVVEPDHNEIFHILMAMGYPESLALNRI